MTRHSDSFCDDLIARVKQTITDQIPLRIIGGETKRFLYGDRGETSRNRSADDAAETLNMCAYHGIVEYEPSELVVTVRAGTRLTTLQAILEENGQMLPFEPPLFGAQSTVGGVVASGLAGPARPFLGSVRDNLLGCKVINGKAQLLQFGGRVIKNVAGYDITRLMAGAMGTLGILLELSIKVLPKPPCEVTLAMPAAYHEALDIMSARVCKPLPLSALCYDGEAVVMRLSGNEAAVADAQRKIAGESLTQGAEFWQTLNNQSHYFFEESLSGQVPLWRLSLAPATLALDIPGNTLLDWCGGQRWLKSNEPASKIRDAIENEGGHATLFRAGKYSLPSVSVFHPLAPTLQKYQHRIKAAFDPHRILNRNRYYPDNMENTPS
ncbi:MAG: glycolate oxidase subunit GlcE [Thiohalomonadales bacterium]